jgi:hypothetical protein
MYKNAYKIKEFNKNCFQANNHKISAFSENSSVSVSAQNRYNKTQNSKICKRNRTQRTRISGHIFGSCLDLINAVTTNICTNYSYTNKHKKHVTVAVMIMKIGVMDAVEI